jgi:HEAT repeat protein
MSNLNPLALCVLLSAFLTPEAQAKKPAPPEGSLSLEEIAVMLASPQQDEVRTAIEASAVLGEPDIIPMIEERIKAGLPPKLLDAAIDTMILIADPKAGQVFLPLARHRRSSVRVTAIKALAGLRVDGAGDVLIKALSDLEPDVRAAAATGLAELGTTKGVNALFRAFEKDVAGAANALGLLVDAKGVERALGYLGRVPLTSLTPIFDAVLARKDLSEAVRQRVVTQLTDLGTAEARGYLEGVRQTLPPDTPAKLRRAIDDAIGRIRQ